MISIVSIFSKNS